MDRTTFTARLDATADRRVRELASDLADMVAAGEMSDTEANQRLSDFQDRIARDGAWG